MVEQANSHSCSSVLSLIFLFSQVFGTKHQSSSSTTNTESNDLSDIFAQRRLRQAEQERAALHSTINTHDNPDDGNGTAPLHPTDDDFLLDDQELAELNADELDEMYLDPEADYSDEDNPATAKKAKKAKKASRKNRR